MEFQAATTPRDRQELRTYLYRYRHAVNRQQAIAFGALNDLEEALKLLRWLVESFPPDRRLGKVREIEAFLRFRTDSTSPADSGSTEAAKQG